MSVEANKIVVRRYLEEVFNHRNLEALDQFADERFRPGVIELVGKLHTALSDFHITVEDVIAEGDKVVTHETLQGMHTGEYMSPTLGAIRPTAKPVKWTRVAIRRLRDGKFVQGFYGVNLRAEGAKLALLEHVDFVPPLRG